MKKPEISGNGIINTRSCGYYENAVTHQTLIVPAEPWEKGWK